MLLFDQHSPVLTLNEALRVQVPGFEGPEEDVVAAIKIINMIGNWISKDIKNIGTTL